MAKKETKKEAVAVEKIAPLEGLIAKISAIQEQMNEIADDESKRDEFFILKAERNELRKSL